MIDSAQMSEIILKGRKIQIKKKKFVDIQGVDILYVYLEMYRTLPVQYYSSFFIKL